MNTATIPKRSRARNDRHGAHSSIPARTAARGVAAGLLLAIQNAEAIGGPYADMLPTLIALHAQAGDRVRQLSQAGCR